MTTEPLTDASPEAICKRFVHDWNQSVSTFSDDDFLKLYSPSIVWLDHAFQIRRTGRDAIAKLRQNWHRANADLVSSVKAIVPTPQGAVLQLSVTGKFVGDLMPKRAASGKSFEYPACFVFGISGEGLIERVDEYYSMLWDEAVGEDKYLGSIEYNKAG